MSYAFPSLMPNKAHKVYTKVYPGIYIQVIEACTEIMKPLCEYNPELKEEIIASIITMLQTDKNAEVSTNKLVSMIL